MGVGVYYYLMVTEYKHCIHPACFSDMFCNQAGWFDFYGVSSFCKNFMIYETLSSVIVSKKAIYLHF